MARVNKRKAAASTSDDRQAKRGRTQEPPKAKAQQKKAGAPQARRGARAPQPKSSPDKAKDVSDDELSLSSLDDDEGTKSDEPDPNAADADADLAEAPANETPAGETQDDDAESAVEDFHEAQSGQETSGEGKDQHASESAPQGRSQTSGKGVENEAALEHATAVREEVDRRRKENQSSHSTHPKPTELRTDKNSVTEDLGNGVSITTFSSEKPEGSAAEPTEDNQDDDEANADPLDGLEVTQVKVRPVVHEERQGIIKFVPTTNDGRPRSMIILTGLKNLFQRQLPKMPREYIARLVFDRNHYSLAIVKRGLEVVGGITYRPFEKQQFAEIVFCAITGTEQVKGYGSALMNHLKDHVRATSACRNFLTYADNYAIGYFRKQGFSKEVTLERSKWAAYIKDYEGGTIMHCRMLPKIKYVDVSAKILPAQKELVIQKIRERSQSHIIRPGIDAFRKISQESMSNLSDTSRKIDPADVPGLKEAGWTEDMDAFITRPQRSPQHSLLQHLLTDMQNHPSSWAFARPVNSDEVPDYYDVIQEPMDLETMEYKLDSNQYKDLDAFLKDARLIFSNCRFYNNEASNYTKNANRLEKYLNEQVKVYTDQ